MIRGIYPPFFWENKMNEVQILSGWNVFVITGTVLSALWAGAYILSWFAQWSWAWVDETEVSSNNWVVHQFVRKEKSGEKVADGWYDTGSYGGRFVKYRNGLLIKTTGTYSDVRADGSDPHKIPPIKEKDEVLLLYPFIPLIIWFSMVCLNFWWISMWFAMAFGTAFTLRMARRGQKLLTKHIADKDAHKVSE